MRCSSVICILAVLMACASPAMAGGYKDYNPTLQPVKDTGFVFFIIQGIPRVDSPGIHIIPGNLTAMENVSYEDMGFYATLNMTAFPTAPILPDGTTVPLELGAGFYTAYMEAGYGTEPEIHAFKVGGGAYEIVSFVGVAVSGTTAGCK